MPTPPMSAELIRETLRLVAQHGGVTPAAKAMGITRSTLHSRYMRAIQITGQRPAEARPSKPAAATPPREQFERSGDGDNEVITSVSRTVRTLQDALTTAKVDLSIWEVERYVVNKWDSVAKLAGEEGGQQLHATELWQVKVWLRRAVSRAMESTINSLLQRLKAHAPKYPSVKRTKKVSRPHMLEVDLFDCHFGKLCWAAETGNNYDLKIAERIYRQAVDDILAKTAGYAIDKIVLPIGNDFFNIDNLQNTTANGTPQDVDERYPKIFLAGKMATIYAIDRLREVAPVEVVLVPGNHDKISSWHLAVVLHAVYAKASDVTVDISPMSRKVIRYGDAAIGFTHGDEEKPETLSRILLAEVLKRGWQGIRHYEFHVGHLHKAKETRFTGVDTFGNVVIRVMRSLSGTDAYHFRKGYVDGLRAAQGNLWSPTDGLVGQFSAIVPPECAN